MKAQIIKIGNSKAIRIPKALLQESGIGEYVEILAKPNQIVIRSLEETRKGWEEAFRSMAEKRDDVLFDEEYLTDQRCWDNTEWEW